MTATNPASGDHLTLAEQPHCGPSDNAADAKRFATLHTRQRCRFCVAAKTLLLIGELDTLIALDRGGELVAHLDGAGT